MSYYVLRSATQRTKSITSFLLALFMVLQVVAPTIVLAAPHAPNGDEDAPKVKVCHEDEDGNWHEQEVNQYSWNNKHDDNDFKSDGDHEHNQGDNHHGDEWCHEHKPNDDKPCLIPVTLEGGTKITSFGASTDGAHMQLQDLLDNAGYTINTLTQETGYQTWNVPAGTDSVTISAKFINGVSGYSNTFGYYKNGDLSTFVPLFTNTVNPVGYNTGAIVINTTGVTSIGFAIQSVGAGQKYATQFSPTAVGSSNAGEDHAVVYKSANDTYVLGFEDLTPLSTGDNDYQDMIAEVKVVSCTHGNQCVPGSGTVSSDTTTKTKVTAINDVAQNSDSVLVTSTSITTQYWTATVGDVNAKWIWSEDPVAGWTADKTATFTKTFNVTGTPNAGSITIAADNTYDITLNGHAVGADTTGALATFQTAQTYPIPANYYVTGANTLVIKVKNLAQDGEALNNPAGLLYTLSWSSNCGGDENPNHPTHTVTFHKYLDGAAANTNESFALNWATGNSPTNAITLNSGNSFTQTTTSIDENTAVSWTETMGDNMVSTVESCTPGKFYNDGFSWGNDLSGAVSNKSLNSAGVPSLSSNIHVVVWNKSCPSKATVVATKIVCTNEADLPNWGTGQGGTIAANTASTFLASHQNCHVQPNWTFQWAPSVATNPGDNEMSAGSPWTNSGVTANDGTISIDIPVSSNGGFVWMREVPKAGYIPFTSDTDSSNGWSDVSAEMYCNVDHLNYDNFDRVDNMVAGQTYYCVAWNVPTTTQIDVCPNLEGIQLTVPEGRHLDDAGQCVLNTNGGGETKTFATTTVVAADLAANTAAVLLSPTKWFFYDDVADVINNGIGSFVTGPAGVVLGTGSAQMSVTGNERPNLATYQFSNVKLSDIKTLRFSTYSKSAGNGSPASERSAYLHFNVSFDGLDTWQKRLVYVPASNGTVVNDSWQEWDAINSGNALWVYSGATWPVTGEPGTTAKTWNQILAQYPNIQTRTTDSWLGLRVGEPYADGFTGTVDNFVIAIKSGSNTHTQTFDFEPTQVVVLTNCTENCGGDNNKPSDTPQGGSSRSGGSRRGSVAGASTNVPNVPSVLGATTDVPNLPNTGNGARSQTLMITLSLIVSLFAINAVAIRKMKNS